MGSLEGSLDYMFIKKRTRSDIIIPSEIRFLSVWMINEEIYKVPK